jgi:hypothetical protein
MGGRIVSFFISNLLPTAIGAGVFLFVSIAVLVSLSSIAAGIEDRRNDEEFESDAVEGRRGAFSQA